MESAAQTNQSMKNKWILSNKALAQALLQKDSVGDFLNFYYQQTKKEWPAFSYQWLAREMGVSKSLVIGIFNGTKKLNAKNVQPLLVAIELPKPIQEYFEFIFSLESDTAQIVSSKRKEKILKNLRETFFDSIDDSVSFDIAISDPDFAVLYAALGDQDSGATVEEILKKIKWPEERIRFLLNELKIKKFVKMTADGNWKGTKKFISTVASGQTDWLPKLFSSTLKRHEKMAEANFFSKDHLSLTYTFCMNQNDYVLMNDELKRFMNKMMEKYHDGQGDKIISMMLGTHPN